MEGSSTEESGWAAPYASLSFQSVLKLLGTGDSFVQEFKLSLCFPSRDVLIRDGVSFSSYWISSITLLLFTGKRNRSKDGQRGIKKVGKRSLEGGGRGREPYPDASTKRTRTPSEQVGIQSCIPMVREKSPLNAFPLQDAPNKNLQLVS